MGVGGVVRRQDQAEWRRERLLDAALDAFVDKGIDGASVKDIARGAGVAPGLLYHYFPGKEELALALVRERGFLPQLRELLAGAAGRPAVEVMRELVSGFSQVLAANAPLVSLFFQASAAKPVVREALRELMAEGQDLLACYLDGKVAAGDLRPHDTRMSAQLVFSTVAVGQLTGSAVDVDALVELFLNGVAGHRGDGDQTDMAREA